MSTTLNTTFYYFTTISEDGRKSYEGYSNKQTAVELMNERIEDNIRQGRTEHIEYVGMHVPFAFTEPEIAYAERNYQMIELQGSEKRIEWARTIRYRFSVYLGKRYSEEEAKSEYARYNNQALASYWINNRYSLAITVAESKYIAEGVGNIWAM